MNQESICLKIKRQNVTFYTTADPKDTVASLKARIAEAQNYAVENQRLFFEFQVLEDARTLREHKIDKDQILYLATRKADGEWEDLAFVKSAGSKA